MKLPFFKKKKLEPVIEELPRPSFDDLNKLMQRIEKLEQAPKPKPVIPQSVASEEFIQKSPSGKPCPHQIQGALDATIIQKELLIKKGVFTRDEVNEAYAELRTKRGK